MKKGIFAIVVAALTLFIAAGEARAIPYYPDPVIKRLNEEDSLPMEEMMELAEQGDPRAQFMLGDMYQKGKGGLPKSQKDSRHWFELSGGHGYGPSFLRLAAAAKRAKEPAEAWMWYTLAISNLDGKAQDFAIAARKELVDEAPLSREDIQTARKMMDEWEDARDERLREEKRQAKEREKEQKEEKQKAEGETE